MRLFELKADVNRIDHAVASEKLPFCSEKKLRPLDDIANALALLIQPEAREKAADKL